MLNLDVIQISTFHIIELIYFFWIQIQSKFLRQDLQVPRDVATRTRMELARFFMEIPSPKSQNLKQDNFSKLIFQGLFKLFKLFGFCFFAGDLCCRHFGLRLRKAMVQRVGWQWSD